MTMRPDDAASPAQDVTALIGTLGHAELFILVYLATDLLSVRATCGVPRTMTTGAAIRGGVLDVNLLRSLAMNPVESDLLEALIAAA